MSVEDISQQPEHPLTREERVLRDRGEYVPPEVKTEILGALKALAREQGCISSDDRNAMEIHFGTGENFGRNEFIVQIIGVDLPGEFQKIGSHIEAYIKKHELPFSKARVKKESDRRYFISGTNFQDVMGSIVDGFINKHAESEFSRVDNLEELMMKYAPKTWEKDFAQGRSI